MRNLGLDLLRLAAVLLVLGRHLHLPPDAHPFLKFWNTGGWIGVDLFFVLSGFLVSGLIFIEYQRTKTVDLKRFLIRRGFKIYPAFFFFIAATCLYLWVNGQEISTRLLVGEVLFLQNYVGGMWNHTWSLAVEEHFYFGLALLALLLLGWAKKQPDETNPFRYIPLVFLVVALLCLSLRILTMLVYDGFSYRAFLFGTHVRIDSLMFGVFLSYIWHFRELESRISGIHTASLIFTGLVLLAPAFFVPLEENEWISVFGVILFYLGSGSLVLAVMRMKASNNRLLLLLGALGAASYSIYLWHMPIGSWGWKHFSEHTGFNDFLSYFLFTILGALIFGWLMNKFLEWPSLKLRDRLFPKQVKVQPAPSKSSGKKDSSKEAIPPKS